jgi:hypothetical protein
MDWLIQHMKQIYTGALLKTLVNIYGLEHHGGGLVKLKQSKLVKFINI